MSDALLEIEDLVVQYVAADGVRTVVDHVSLTVDEGEIVGLCGESGSGKSTLVHAVMRTLGSPGLIVGGQVRYRGQDILSMDEDTLRTLRWKELSIVFQSAMDSLNPVMTVQAQIEDTLLAHGEMDAQKNRARVHELLDMVGVEGRWTSSYPHELSGGMRQRVSIALALALEPRLVIMDEPTTALDVIVERSILDNIRELRDRLGFAVIFITHDLQRLLEISDKMGVMRHGVLLEFAQTQTLEASPQHEYTQHLLNSYPTLKG